MKTILLILFIWALGLLFVFEVLKVREAFHILFP